MQEGQNVLIHAVSEVGGNLSMLISKEYRELQVLVSPLYSLLVS